MAGRPHKFSNEDLAKKALAEQKKSPLLSEGAIMGVLGVGRQYLADRAKESAPLRSTRDEMAAVRQYAWEVKGHLMLDLGMKECNPTMFIWMTRNVLGWRDRQKEDEGESDGGTTPTPRATPLTVDDIAALVKAAKGDKSG